MTYNSLCALSRQFATNPTVAQGLCDKLAAATHAAPSTCTATIRISGTDFGTVVVTGNQEHYHGFRVAGSYESGVLTGASFTGTQEVRENLVNGRATVQGTWLATDAASTLTTRYATTISGSGDVRGAFSARDGTGTLADAQWNGTIRGQLVSLDEQGLPTYAATLSGPCRNLP